MPLDLSGVFDRSPPQPWSDARAFIDALFRQETGPELPLASASNHEETPRHSASRAVAGGLAADRVAYAFLAGYHAACDALVAPAAWPAICVTETGPPHPRNIACTWRDGHLDGTKTFVTGGPFAQTLHVLAVVDDGRPSSSEVPRSFVLATIAADAPGVEIEALPAAPFVPEVPHGRVVFRHAAPSCVRDDGWAGYVKPFRTVEDIHVTLAVAAYVARALHRHGGPAQDIDALLAVMSGLYGLAQQSASSPATHRGLAGVLALAAPIWSRTQLAGDEGERWTRDQRLLSIAAKARDARRQAAWDKTS